MKALNVHEAKTKLSAVLAEVEKGEKFLICRNGKPIAELIPYEKGDRLTVDPLLSQVKINTDLTKPLTEDEWELA